MGERGERLLRNGEVREGIAPRRIFVHSDLQDWCQFSQVNQAENNDQMS